MLATSNAAAFYQENGFYVHREPLLAPEAIAAAVANDTVYGLAAGSEANRAVNIGHRYEQAPRSRCASRPHCRYRDSRLQGVAVPARGLPRTHMARTSRAVPPLVGYSTASKCVNFTTTGLGQRWLL